MNLQLVSPANSKCLSFSYLPEKLPNDRMSDYVK